MPTPDDDPALYESVNQYQTNKHSKSYRKYKNKLCRYGFGKFITEKIIIAQPLEDGIKDVERYFILKKKDAILSKFSDFINKYLLKTHIGNIYLLMVFCWNCN